MKIQYASDIHLELSDNSRFIKTMPFEVAGDVLVLAGDTGYLRDRTLPNLKFWKWASANYREVLLVPGNHEFYGNGDVLAYGDSWSREILPNVHYHQNKVVRIDDTDFILSTLWSHISPQDEYFVSRGMNDFRQILYGGRRFTTDDFNVEHQKCLAFIKQSVSESYAKRIVVVTHHLPTLEVVAPQHKGSQLNSAFATELGDFIADSRIDVWVFGHSHANIDAPLAIVASMLACEWPNIQTSIRLSAIKSPSSVVKALFNRLPLCWGATTSNVGRWCVTTTICLASLLMTLCLINARHFSCSALKSSVVNLRPPYSICLKSFMPRLTKYSS